MITTFRTKKEVTANTRTNEQAIVYLDIYIIEWNGSEYTGRCVYYYIKDDARYIIEDVYPRFTNEECIRIQQAAQITGYKPEVDLKISIAATQMQLSTNRYFGTTAEDWEMYYPPVEELVEN